MKVILLTDVPKIGNRYDVKELKDGYAKNVLIPKGLACLATKNELTKLEDMKRKMENKKQEEIKIIKDLISLVSDKEIIIKAKASEKGSLFKSINEKDVSLAIKNLFKIDIDEKLIKMDHIKSIGTFFIKIQKGDQMGECKILVDRE